MGKPNKTLEADIAFVNNSSHLLKARNRKMVKELRA